MQASVLPEPADRPATRLPRRFWGLVLALLVEGLVLLVLLTMVPGLQVKPKPKPIVFGIEAGDDKPAAPTVAEKAKSKPKSGGGAQQPVTVRDPVDLSPPVPPAARSPSTVIWLSRREYNARDITDKSGNAPAAAGQGNGQSDRPDSALAGGRGPHGEPLYAAEWYREPTDRELSPYISERARGRGGWGVIACRTAANYRVEDCQEIDDSPRGSGYAGAVRQASFQFRVRPPRVGGKPLVGSWVRIMITYSVRETVGDGGRPGPQ